MEKRYFTAQRSGHHGHLPDGIFVAKNWQFSRFLSGLLSVSLILSSFPLSLLSFPSIASAAFNPEINYQGKLTDASNVAVPDGTYNVSLRLYTAAAGATTTAIWSEDRVNANRVTVSNGLFSVLLGSVTAFPASFDWNRTLYLGVEIGGTTTPGVWDGEMTPRKQLGAVPAAFTADRLDNIDSTQFVRTDATSTIASSSPDTTLTVNQTGSGNVLDLQTSGISRLLLANNGNLGIGTSSPYAKLSVAGDVVATRYVSTSTTATSTFGHGIDVASGCIAVGGVCLPTTSGITTLNGLAGLSQSFATSSDTNITLSIVSSGATHTFNPGWTGTLSGIRGGTGLGTITTNQLLLGAAGNTWVQIATSSLGLLTTNVAEGTNQYFTDARARSAVTGLFPSTTTPNTWTALQTFSDLIATNATNTNATSSYLSVANHLFSGTSTLTTIFGTTATFANATTTNLGVTGQITATGAGTSTFSNGIALSNGCFRLPSGSCLTDTTGITSLNTLTALSQSFATSSDTNITLSIISSGSTHTFNPGWTGTLEVARGGTGLSSTPNFGEILRGNGAGGYALVATSTLGINILDTTGTLTVPRGGTGLTSVTDDLLLLGGPGNTILQIATSSLGLLTTNVAEGTNQYFTDARARSAVTGLFPATTSLNTWTALQTFSDLIATNATNTNATSSYLSVANHLFAGTATIPTLIGTNATTTNLGVTGQITQTSSATSSFTGGISTGGLASSNGLHITNGGLRVNTLNTAGCDLKSDTNGSFYCGTDAGAAGSEINWTWFNASGVRLSTTTQQVLIGAVATTSSAKLEVAGDIRAEYFTATSTTATSSLTRTRVTELEIAAANGILRAVSGYVRSDSTTTNLPEGTNQYFTDARARSAVTGLFPSTTTPNTWTALQTFSDLIATNATNTNATSSYLSVANHLFSGTSTLTTIFGTTATFANATTTNLGVTGQITATGAGTSTFANGIALSNGCFRLPSGSCLTDTTGITSLNTLTALSQSFATSSDTNITLSIVSSGATHTFNPGWTGTLDISRGGTGLSSTPNFGEILRGNGAGGYALVATSTLGINILDTTGTLTVPRGGTGLTSVTDDQLLIGGPGNTILQIATSSLGLLTTNVSEGTNQYFTDARARSAVTGLFPATTSPNTWTALQTFSDLIATNATNTNATSSYLSVANHLFAGTATIPTLIGTNATVTNLGVTGQITQTSSATSSFTGGISTGGLASSNGLHITNGGLRVNTLNTAGCDLKSDTNGSFYCGTDAGAAGSEINWTWFNASGVRLSTTTQQVLIGAVATTSSAKLEVAGDIRAEYFTATSTTASVFPQLSFTNATGTSLHLSASSTIQTLWSTFATTTNLGVTGQITSTGAATSSFAGGLSLSGGCFQDTSGKCIGKGRDGTYIVAAYNSTNKAYADYVADYNNDEVQINQAITAAYSAARGRGGKVYLLEGDFRVGTSTASGDAIVMATSTSLIGAGNGTTITVASSTPGNINVIAANNLTEIAISDLTINGNKANQTTGTQSGVNFSSTASSTVMQINITDVRTDGLSVTSSRGNKITLNTIMRSGASGVQLVTSDFNIIEGNTINSNTTNGVNIVGSNSNTVSANSIGQNSVGVSVFGGGTQSYNTIANNVVWGSLSYGINMSAFAGAVTHNIVTGNVIRDSVDYGIGVHNFAASNSIIGNSLYNNGGSGAVSSIFIGIGASQNIISGNRIVDTAGTAYAIDIQGASAPSDNVLTGNYYSGTGATRINDAGLRTKYTQWDRITLENPSGSIPEVTYSLLGIVASTTAPLASTTQTGAGKLLSLNNTVGEMFTVSNSGLVGIGTSSPYAKLSVVGETVAAFFTATTTSVNTFPTLLSTNASTTNLGVTGQITQTGAATSSFTGGLSLGTGGLHITNGGLRVNNLNTASCDLKSDTNGVFFCGTDAVGGGSSSEVNWTYNYAGLTRVSSSTSQVLIGAVATTSSAKLEVAGDIRAEYFTATSTTASVFPQLSFTNATGTSLHLSASSTIQTLWSTFATTTNLGVTGQITSTGAATSSFAGGIALSGGCFQDTSGKCIGKGRDGTYIVAAYNSTNKAYADYVADYNNDEVQINQAITAAYSATRGRGGKVYLLEGDFRVGTSTPDGDAIVMATSTSLIGAGNGTTITVASSTPGNINVIAARNLTATPMPDLVIADLLIDGNKVNQTTGTQYGIYLNAGTSTVERLVVKNMRTNGLYLDAAVNNTIDGNTLNANGLASGNAGIYLNQSNTARNNIVGNSLSGNFDGIYITFGPTASGNTISGNTISGSSDDGIECFVGAGQVTITGNTITGNADMGVAISQCSNNVITGNTISGNTGAGVVVSASTDNTTISANTIMSNIGGGVLLSGDQNTVTANTVSSNTTIGIDINSSSNSTISGNIVNGNTTHGIRLIGGAGSPSGNAIVGNVLYNNGGAGANHGIFLDFSVAGPISNLIAGNRITDTAGTGFAINIENAASTNNVLSGNYYSGTGATRINDAGTNTKYTQWDRITLENPSGSIPEVTYSLLGIVASTTAPLASTTQTGAGKLLSLNNTVGEMFTVSNSGLVGIGTTSPYAKLSVVGETVAAFFTATTTSVNTFPTLLSTNASTTNLGVTGQITQTGAATSSFTGGLSLGTGGLYITNGGIRVANLNTASCDLKSDTNGVFFCGTDAVGAASSPEVNWTYNYAGLTRVASSTSQVLIGATATTSTSKLEVAGDIRAEYFTATSTTASVFPQLSFTNATGTSLHLSASSTIQTLWSTFATTTNLGITGQITSTGAATSTFAGGLSLSGGCFRSAQGKCIGGGQESTYIVAAYNSRNKEFADYVADYNNDEVEINQAITAAYSAARGRGGKVYLLEGDFRVGTSTPDGDAIVMATSTSLIGAGNGTTITLASSTPGDASIIAARFANEVTISDLLVDGNYVNQSINGQYGILLFSSGSSTIERTTVTKARNAGIVVLSNSTTLSTFNRITNNHISNINPSLTTHAIQIQTMANVIANNTITSSPNGILLNSGASNERNNIVVGNIIDVSGLNGISSTERGNTITGNTIRNGTGTGINVGGMRTVVSNNLVMGQASHAILVSDIDVIVIGNSLYNNGGSGANDGIRLSGNGEAIISGNRIVDTAGTGYAINISSGSNTILTGNYYSGTGATRINDAGTNTKYTQWDRITLENPSGSIPQVTYSLLGIVASTTAPLASTTQTGAGKLLSLNNTVGEMFTVSNNGLVGIGTTSPYAKLSVVGETVSAFFTATTTSVNTFPTLLSTNATTTNLGVTGQITQTGAATSSFTGGLSLGTGGLHITNGGLRVNNLNTASCDLKSDTNGVFFCGTDAVGAGSSSEVNWTYNYAGLTRVSSSTSQVLIGATATTSTSKLEVAGDIRAEYFTATSTTASVFPQLSFTNATGTSLHLSASSTIQTLWSTFATTTNLGVTGQITSTGAATSSFAGGISLSGGCFQDTSGKCIGKGRDGTYIVAAYNSTNKAYADYVADYNNDEVQINQAITAAYSNGRGGKVYLLEGDFRVGTSTAQGDAIVMATSTSLIGAGLSTRIFLASSTPGNANIIAANNMHHLTIADLLIDGNSANQTTGTQNGILFTAVSTSTIRNIVASSTRNVGITLQTGSYGNMISRSHSNLNSSYGIHLISSSGNTITGNTTNLNGTVGIYLSVTSSYNTVTGNTANANGSYGVFIASSFNNSVAGNTANSNSTGIYLNSSNNSITGNTVDSNSLYGIYVNSNSSNNSVAGNSASLNGTYGIYLSSSDNNTVTGNSLSDNGGTGGNDSIRVATSNGNIISSNRIVDTAGTGYAINITATDSSDNVLTGNYYSGTGATRINDLGTKTKYTEWDRITLENPSGSIPEVTYSLLGIVASTTAPLASTTQMGSGKLLSLNNTVGEMFTVANNGYVGIGTSSPYAKLSVTGQVAAEFFTGTSTTASSTFASNVSIGTATSSGAEYQIGGRGILTRLNGAVILGETEADARGIFALDLQSVRTASTQVASGANSIAVGRGNTAGGSSNISIGISNTSGNLNAIAIGASNTSNDVNTTAIGRSNNITAQNSSAFGSSNTFNATAASSLTFGDSNAVEASASGVAAFGVSNTVGGTNASAFGRANIARLTNSSAFGYQNWALGTLSSAMGASSTANGLLSSAFGYNNLATAQGASAFGSNLTNTTASSTDLGPDNASKVTVFNSGIFQASSLNISSTTATSTFANGIEVTTAGGLHLSNGGLRVNNLNTASCDLKSDTNGVFFCGTDAVGAGSSSEVNWTYNYAGLTRVSSSTSQVLIGATATTSTSKLEVAGDIRAEYFTATSTTASVFPQLSFTNATGTSLHLSASSTIQTLWSTFATTTNLGITGQITSTGAATSTFAGGLSLSGGCFQDTSGKCIGKGRDGTYIVAAYNSTNKAYADYITNFSSDETEINQALQAAYNNGRGGKVYLLEGDYVMSTGAGDKIVMATSTSLIGQGLSTRIFIASSTDASVDVIDANRTPFITIADLMIDGNSPRNSSGTQNGIVFTAVSTSTIRNIVASSTRTSGIRLLSSSDGNMVANSIINLNSSSGVDINASSRNLLQGNQLLGNSIYGIIQTGGTLNRYSNNGISGTGAGGSGIHLTLNTERNIVEGNSIVGGAGIGIAVYSGGTHNLISNNVVANNADMGIAVYFNDPTENQVTGNLLRDNAGAGSSANLFVDADRTMVSGNYIIDSAGTGVAINIAAGANNIVVGNTYTGTGATRMSNLGTGTKFTQWDRITLENPSGSIPEVTYSLLGIVASTTAPLASTTQTGAGKLLSLNNTVGEMFTVANNGYVGIGTSSPYAKLSVTGEIATEFFTATSTTATSSIARTLKIGQVTAAGGANRLDIADTQSGIGSTYFTNRSYLTVNPSVADDTSIFENTLNYTEINSAASMLGTVIGQRNEIRRNDGVAKNTYVSQNVYTTNNSGGNANSSTTVGTYNTLSVSRTGMTTTNLIGTWNVPNLAAGAVTNMYGALNEPQNTSGGTGVTNAYGTYNAPKVLASTISNAFASYNTLTNTAGTITNGYGVYIDVSAQASNAWSIYSTGTARSYFNGNVGIGTTSPYAKLSVVGETVSAFFTATTTSVNTFPTLLSTNATTTNLGVTGQITQTGAATSSFTGGLSLGTGGLHITNGGLRVNNLNTASCDLKSDTNGVFFCGTDAVGGGSSSEVNWTYNYAGLTRVSSSTSQVLIGATATTSTSKLEVAGDIRAEYFTATSTTATSTFANGISLSGGCFQDTSGKCIGKGRDGTYIVAAYNSTNKAYADYITNFSSDETEINQAITAAYNGGRGGKVYLLEGDYVMSTGAGDKIVMATSTSLIGQGPSTRIFIASSTNANVDVIDANRTPHITIADLMIDGNSPRNSSGTQNGIVFTAVSTSTIRNVVASSTRDNGITLQTTSYDNLIADSRSSLHGVYGILLNSSSNNTVTGNTANSNSNYGIFLNSSSNNTVTGNTTNSNSNNGIALFTSSNSNTVTGNTANSNSTYGIILNTSSNSNTVTGNTANSNSTYGIYLDTTSNNTVTGNTANSNSSHGIYLSFSSNNSVTGNSLYDNGGTGGNDSIRIASSDQNIVSSNIIQDTAGTGYAVNITSSASDNNILTGNYYSGTGATSIRNLGTNTKFTQWDRITLENPSGSIPEVTYSLLGIVASTTAPLASTTQTGAGKLLSLNNTVGEMFTVANSGLVGIGTSTPWGKLSVEMDTTNPAFIVKNDASSTPSIYIAGVNQNGFVGFGTTTNYGGSHARIFIDASTSISGVTTAIAGVHSLYTFAPAAGGTQVGDRTVVVNAATGTTPNTGVGRILRITDNSSLSNLVRGIEVVASVGGNTLGVNTGIRGTGHTFGIQGITTGLAGGTSTPAAIYGENTGDTQGDVLRLYTASMTTATSMAQFFQESSAFSGAGLLMNFAAGSGSFTGNFLDLQYNSNSRFKVTAAGTTTIGQLNQTVTAAGLQIGYGGLCVDNDGSCVASTTGRVSAVSYTTGATDLAENYYSDDALEAGDIVSTEGKYFVGKAATATDVVLGVVATKPGIILGESDRRLSDKPAFPIGLVGRVPVKVSTENGPIKIGDRIALSNLPGVGMSAVGTSSPVAGAIVGIALEEFSGEEYLSEATIEVMTETVASGTPVCVSTQVVRERKESGGADVEEGSDLAKAVDTYTDTVETCTQERVTVSPDAGIAMASTTLTEQTVRVGKILMFIDLSVERILPKTAVEPTEPGMVWIDDGTGAAEILQNLDLNGHGIRNVSRIASASGNWYIDEEGNIGAGTITARRVIAEEYVEVGTGSRPTGITIYDTMTGLPYCMQVAAGALASTPGACSPTSIPPASGGATPEPEPAPVSESEPPVTEPVSEMPSEEPAPEVPAPSDESISTEAPVMEPVSQPEASPEEAVVPAPEAAENAPSGQAEEAPIDARVP